MMPSVTAAMILRRAAARLISNGWQQHAFGEPGGPTCAGGAIHYTCVEAGTYEQIENVEDEALKAVRRRTRLRLADWNDVPGRTLEDVILTLTGAASDLEAA